MKLTQIQSEWLFLKYFPLRFIQVTHLNNIKNGSNILPSKKLCYSENISLISIFRFFISFCNFSRFFIRFENCTYVSSDMSVYRYSELSKRLNKWIPGWRHKFGFSVTFFFMRIGCLFLFKLGIMSLFLFQSCFCLKLTKILLEIQCYGYQINKILCIK